MGWDEVRYSIEMAPLCEKRLRIAYGFFCYKGDVYCCYKDGVKHYPTSKEEMESPVWAVWASIASSTNTSKYVKGPTGQLVNLSFSARHIGISVWVLTKKMTSITASSRENVAAIVLFYTPSAKTTKAIFAVYAGELPQDEYKGLISKHRKFSYLVFSLRLS